jgi:hypothetical protein
MEIIISETTLPTQPTVNSQQWNMSLRLRNTSLRHLVNLVQINQTQLKNNDKNKIIIIIIIIIMMMARGSVVG